MDEDFFDRQRRQFPALNRRIGPHSAVFLDGPAGTQVPQRVISAISDYLATCNANHGGLFATSRESDAILDAAHQAAADLLGIDDPGTIAFGPNMTTLTLGLSRALSRTWSQNDEILVTRLDHDANYSPWVLAARDAGATVKVVDIHPEDCTLDLDDFRRQLTNRTRLVAVGCASNATGTVNPIADIISWSHEAGARVFLDAVHFAPHSLMRVPEWNCDFLACSAYKFFGPHIGILWGRRELLQELPAYKVRPAPDEIPGKWMTGTQNHECIAGVLEAIEYLSDLGRSAGADSNATRRENLSAAFSAIEAHERRLARQFIEGLADLPSLRLHGIADQARAHLRLPTFAITHRHKPASQLATELGERGFFVWHGNYYALNLTERLGLEPEGMVRIGFVHYNTPEEIDRLLTELRKL